MNPLYLQVVYTTKYEWLIRGCQRIMLSLRENEEAQNENHKRNAGLIDHLTNELEPWEVQ